MLRFSARSMQATRRMWLRWLDSMLKRWRKGVNGSHTTVASSGEASADTRRCGPTSSTNSTGSTEHLTTSASLSSMRCNW